jgi:hypothetical protein
MVKHTFKMSDVTGDTRVLARSSLGYDFNYFADDETIIFGTGSDATIAWDGDSLNVTSAATEFTGTVALGTTAQMTAGTGVTTGTGTLYKAGVVQQGTIIETTLVFDITGLSSNVAGDIIGKAGGTANCHFGQITAATNGTILGGYMTCLEVPAGGSTDIDVYSATVATGAEDAAIGDLTETALLAHGGAWAATALQGFTTVPVADGYLYLTNGGSTSDNAYTAGKFVIKLYGYDA